MEEKLSKFVEEIKGLTVLELSNLVKALEEEFGVSAAAPMAVAAAGAPAAGGEEEAAEEKSSFDVVLESAGSSKIPVIKAVKEVTGLSLMEAKELVNKAPSNIKEGVSSEEAEKIKEQLTSAGATVALK